MESIGGMGTAINQANSIGSQDVAVQQGIALLNNKNTNDYLVAMRDEKSTDKHVDENNLQRIGQYGLAVGEKVTQAKEFVKEGGDLYKNFGTVGDSSIVGKLGKAGSKVASLVSGAGKPLEYVGADAGHLEAMSKKTQALADLKAGRPPMTELQQRGLDPASLGHEGEVFMNEPEQPPASTGQGAPPEELGGHLTTEPTDEHFVQGGADAEGGSGGTQAGAKTLDSTLEEGADKGASVGVKLGKFAGGVAKVGGAMFSAGMLGDDIYNQVKSKKFFYGDNDGDKVGHFMNEMGSVADLGGIATGDPLLVLAGVGLGAVGSVVSDVSELFGHHKKEETDKQEDKPVAIEQSASQNVAGQGEVAQTGLSSLRLVQTGQA